MSPSPPGAAPRPAAEAVAASPAAEAAPEARLVALAGNPNVGKTTLFNRLTGLRQRVGNYPGVTVEHKRGFLRGPGGRRVEVVDVPGLYSLNPDSLDEEVAYRVLTGGIDGMPAPDLVVVVVDSGNLERNLFLVSQVMDLGLPVIVALNMIDASEAAGLKVEAGRLAAELGVPVVPTAASRGRGVAELASAVTGGLPPPPERRWSLEPAVARAVEELAAELAEERPAMPPRLCWAFALRLLTSDRAERFETEGLSPALTGAVHRARETLAADGVAWRQAEVVGRYGWLTPLAERVVVRPEEESPSLSDRLDAVLTHRFAGPAIFAATLALIFQAVFSWAEPAMDWTERGVAALSDLATTSLPPGPLVDLLTEGVIAGVGAVIVFLPQILILFFFLGLLEDSGYMARAAFIMDRVMRRFGLSGRSVVPLLSSFACAIPGIMATRSIDNPRDRLVTILVAPLMTCSARLPVYTLLIGAFVPQGVVLGVFGYRGLALLSLYALGVVFAVLAAWVLRTFLVRGRRSTFVMELPPYRMPRLGDVAWRMVERSKLFVVRAGTIILALSMVLWFLASYPRLPQAAAAPAGAAAAATAGPAAADDDVPARRQLEHSAMGRLGHLVEPVIRPLGYDWKIGVALIASFAAREVAVSALATIYSVGEDEVAGLRDQLRADRDPDTGEPVFTPLVAASLLVFFVFACQCMSTVAVVRRETNSWRWPLFLFAYMTGLAYVASLVTYQGGKLLGLG